MTTKQQRHFHGGPAVPVEPHRIQTVKTGSELGRPLGWYCGDCTARLVYGRDGKFRHRKEVQR